MGKEAELRNELRTHRRLLLSFTFVLVAIYLLDIELKDQLAFQNIISGKVHYPELIPAGLWIAYFWSVWRYWQHERQHRAKGLATDRATIERRRTVAFA